MTRGARKTDWAGGPEGGAREGAGARLRAFWDYQVRDHALLRHAWTNMDEVAPGVWRSNQPTRRRFAALARRGFRTVLNLRGADAASPAAFHRLAREGCAAAGLRLLTVALRSRRAPSRQDLLDLLAAFRAAERPLLIHCKSGADRTGFAAALWLVVMEGRPVAEARRQLSWRYWHLAGGRAGVLGRVLDLYAARLDRGAVGFEDWVREGYDPAEAETGAGR